MKVDLYYCSKPLQYVNLCNIPDVVTNPSNKKILLVYNAFMGAEQFVDNVRIYDKRWDKVILCNSRLWFCNLLRLRVENMFSPLDSTLYGFLHFIFRFNFYLYEEGAGTYNKLFINKKYHLLSKILGIGRQMGHSTYLKGVIVYQPGFYIQQIRPTCKVLKFNLTNREIIERESNLLFKIYENTLSNNIKVRNKKILLYITDWDYDDEIIKKMISISRQYDILFIKPHPHRKKEDLPTINNVIPIYSSILIEVLLQYWLDNNNNVTVFHQSSTAIIPFSGLIDTHDMNIKDEQTQYQKLVKKLCDLSVSVQK